MADPRTNQPPEPMMYGPDEEESDWAGDCDADFTLEGEPAEED